MIINAKKTISGGQKFRPIFSLGMYPVLVASILTFMLLLKQETVAINPIPMNPDFYLMMNIFNWSLPQVKL